MDRRRLKIEIQSHSDIITNSSSEVFMITRPEEVIAEICEDIYKQGWKNIDEGTDRSSGMGGELTIYTWENGFRNYKRMTNRQDATEEEWAMYMGASLEELKNVIMVDVDWGRKKTIEYIKETYGAKSENDKTFPVWIWDFYEETGCELSFYGETLKEQDYEKEVDSDTEL